MQPVRLKIYNMTNPHGLAKDGKHLFVCDGRDGVKLYSTADVNKLKIVDHINGLDAFDVIAQNRLAIVIAKDGLYQFDYSIPNNLRLVSKLSIAR
jgi:hypothetical protein